MKDSSYHPIIKAFSFPCLLIKHQNSQFYIADTNEALLVVSRLERQEILGKLVQEAFPSAEKRGNPDAMLVMDSLQQVVNSLQPHKVKRLRYDIPVPGSEKYQEKYWNIENAPIINEAGELEYILHSGRDVTAEVLAEKKEKEVQKILNWKEQQYQHFVDSNPDGLYSLDAEGGFTSANQGLADMAEVPLQELLKMNFMSFCAPEEREKVISFFEHVLTGEGVKFESTFYTATGKQKVLEISIVPVKQEGRVTGVYGIAKDLTGMRLSEKILVEKKNFLKANATLVASLLENELQGEAVRDTFEVIGKAVAADRMYFYNLQRKEENDQLFVDPQVAWSREKLVTEKNHLEIKDIPECLYEEIKASLNSKKIFSTTLSELKDGEVKKLFLDYNIKSILLLPIYLKEEVYGIIGIDDCHLEREWSDDEVDFLKNIGYNITTVLEKKAAEASIQKQEEALRLSEQKFRALVQEGSDLVGILNPEGAYLFVSESSIPILGYNPEELQGHNAFEFIHPEDQERLGQELMKLHSQDRVKTGPYRFRNSEGNWRWLETTATNLIDDPAVGGIVVNSRDITTQFEQAREIRQISERYQLAAAATQDLLYDWDLVKNEVIRFHQSMPDVFGHSTEEASKKEFWYKNVHPSEVSALNRQLVKNLRDKSKKITYSEYRFRRADGTYAHIIDRAFIIRDEQGKAIRIVGASSDISEVNSKKEALAIANKRFELAMKATDEMIWDWDIVNDEVVRSSAFETLYGFQTGGECDSADYWFNRVVEEDREKAIRSLDLAVEDAEVSHWNCEYRIIKSDGDFAYINDRGYIIRNEAGKALRMVGSALDVTESRKAIERFEHQNRLLKEIAWEQSHVVRAPLARLKGLLQLFELQAEGEMGLSEVLQHLNASAEELDAIVRGIVTRTEKLHSE